MLAHLNRLSRTIALNQARQTCRRLLLDRHLCRNLFTLPAEGISRSINRQHRYCEFLQRIARYLNLGNSPMLSMGDHRTKIPKSGLFHW